MVHIQRLASPCTTTRSMTNSTHELNDVFATTLVSGSSESILIWHCEHDTGLDIVQYERASYINHN